MGWWSSFIGWFSSGVEVLLWKHDDTLKKSVPVIKGAVLIKGKPGKTVLSLEIKVIEEHSYPVEDGEKKSTRTDTTVLGSVKFPALMTESAVEFPLDFKDGVEKAEQPFSVPIAVNQRLRDYSTGMVGSILGFGSEEKTEYFLVAEASVKGSILGASAKEQLKIAE